MKKPLTWLFIVSIYAASLTGYIAGDKRITDLFPTPQYAAQVSAQADAVSPENKLWTDPEKPTIKK